MSIEEQLRCPICRATLRAIQETADQLDDPMIIWVAADASCNHTRREKRDADKERKNRQWMRETERR